MPQTIVLGAGPCGLAAAMMLARDGHRVTVIERDPAPVPEGPVAAWEEWGRAGVAQFRQAHFIQARGRHVLAAELPDTLDALEGAGALRLDLVARLPPDDHRPGAAPGRRAAGDHDRAATDARAGARAGRRGGAGRRRPARRRGQRAGGAARGRPPPRHRRPRRERAGVARGPRRRRHGPALGAARAARRRGRRPRLRRGRGGWLPLLHALLPRRRRPPAGPPRADQQPSRVVLAAHAPGRRGRLVRDGLRRVRGPAAQGAARRHALDRPRARLPAPRPLARRRGVDGGHADGRRRRPLPALQPGRPGS